MELRRGDLIEIGWWDITEDPVGNPSRAVLPTRHSVGYFWSGGDVSLVTTGTMDSDVEDQSGYCIYPIGVIVGIKIIRRGKGKAYRASEPFEFGPVRAEHSRRKATVNPRTDPDVPDSGATGVGGQESVHGG